MINKRQKVFNDMLQTLINYSKQYSDDVDCLLIAAFPNENGQTETQSIVVTNPDAAHCLGHMLHDFTTEGEYGTEIYRAVLTGVVCSAVQAGASDLLQNIMTPKPGETFH